MIFRWFLYDYYMISMINIMIIIIMVVIMIIIITIILEVGPIFSHVKLFSKIDAFPDY